MLWLFRDHAVRRIYPKWHPSIDLKGILRPPFVVNGSNRKIALELFTSKTTFLRALAMGSSRIWASSPLKGSPKSHLLSLSSGARQVAICMVPRFMPTNATPNVIPKPLQFPGIVHLSPGNQNVSCALSVQGCPWTTSRHGQCHWGQICSSGHGLL